MTELELLDRLVLEVVQRANAQTARDKARVDLIKALEEIGRMGSKNVRQGATIVDRDAVIAALMETQKKADERLVETQKSTLALVKAAKRFWFLVPVTKRLAEASRALKIAIKEVEARNEFPF